MVHLGMRATSNSASRAKRYRALADECRYLAEILRSSEAGHYYEETASHYLALAQAEERLAARSTLSGD